MLFLVQSKRFFNARLDERASLFLPTPVITPLSSHNITQHAKRRELGKAEKQK